MAKILETISRFFQTNDSDEVLTSSSLKNVAGSAVNPATEEKQDELIDNQTNGSQRIAIQSDTVDVGSQNPLPTRDFDLDLAFGRIPGHKTIHKYGRNSSVGASEVPVTGGSILNWLTTATTVRVKAGGNAADASAGAGARKIMIVGLDETWAEVEEELTLNANGTLASSPTTTTFIRVLRAYVTETGTYTGVNTGTITIENGAGGTDLIQIQAGEGQTEYGVYTIPTGKTGYLASIYSTVDASKNGSIKMWVRNNADDVTAPYTAKRLKLFFDGLVGGNQFNPRIPLDDGILVEKTDIWFTAISDATGASISVDFEILIKDN